MLTNGQVWKVDFSYFHQVSVLCPHDTDLNQIEALARQALADSYPDSLELVAKMTVRMVSKDTCTYLDPRLG